MVAADRKRFKSWVGILVFGLGVGISIIADAQTASEPTVQDKKTPSLSAIWVKNRAGSRFDNKAGVFEDMVVAQITDIGFAVMSPQDTLQAVRGYLDVEDQNAPGAQLDALLENNTSALRLAQNMQVDYLFVVSIASLATSTQHIKRPELDIDRKVTTHKLQATYKVLGAGVGQSVLAGHVVATARRQQADGFGESSDLIDDLFADASAQIGQQIRARNLNGLNAPKKADLVSFSVVCSMQDLTVPEVVRGDDGTFELTANGFKLEPMAVTVELDGVVVGTAPGSFQAQPGLHKISLTREGFERWERTINVRDDQNLEVALVLSEEGRAYWQQMAEFFAKLKRDQLLADADAELIRGVAQKMRQSGLRIDRRSNINVDTDRLPSVDQTRLDRQVAQSFWPQ